MAIGKAVDATVVVCRFGDIHPDDHKLWYDRILKFGPDLLDGYATLVTNNRPIPPLAAQ
jgi:hypothetical protein